jgi:hypothetical protein
LPALLLVLVVSATGALVLGAGHFFTEIVARQTCLPRNTAGPESIRA